MVQCSSYAGDWISESCEATHQGSGNAALELTWSDVDLLTCHHPKSHSRRLKKTLCVHPQTPPDGPLLRLSIWLDASSPSGP
jgi:hypothetical protein